MARQRGDQSPADFLRGQGWKTQTVLYGAPITSAEKQIERSVVLIVTAIGDAAVLARAAEGLSNRREGMWTFDSRDWYANGQERQSARTPEGDTDGQPA